MFSKEGAAFFPFVLPVITEGGSDNCPGEFLLAGRTNGIEKTGAVVRVQIFIFSRMVKTDFYYSLKIIIYIQKEARFCFWKNKACNLFFVFSFVLAAKEKQIDEEKKVGKILENYRSACSLLSRMYHSSFGRYYCE